ncbi:hypothetical protein ACJIZ3_011851 [Penstemon smallii]|uniref:FRIGIDA-like protein n=1 Tax=Penstemon smallii TaxID=265156 RepID=A0ABD3UKA9_9LAMI
MEKEFHSFREEKERELVLKEQELSIERKELLKGVQLREQQLIEKQSLRDQLLNAAREAFADSEKEVEKRKEEFNLYKENRLRELVLQEEKFSLMKEEFIREVKFKEMKFNKQEKLVHGLLERLESAQNNVKNLKRTLSERFKEIDLKEVELESVRDWVEREMNDAKDMEDNMEVKENKLEGKKMKEKNLGPCAKELEYKEQQLEDIDWMEKNVDSKREFTRICSNEHLAIKNEVQPERDLVEKHDLHLSENEQQPDYRLRELNSKEKQNPVHSKELELKEQQLSDTTIGSNIMIEKDESIDLELKVEIEGELLELLIDAPPEKDFELMASEVYELLIESSDPAKIVLDAVKELSSPHFRKREMVSHVGRLCILLLEKLTIISPTIRACVREEAMKLSSEWKSKMKATGQNPGEVFVFLNLLAAYKLVNLFDKDELLSFLITVAEYKQTPELCRILGFTENMTDFVQKFIQKKQYLLASIYIYEFKLKHTFPQAAVLNYYLRHSKQLAKVKCNSLEAQDKAIVGEITALKVAIEHITKYGLEFDCSPDILKMHIKKLEFERKRLPQKQGKNGHVQPEDANSRNAVLGKQLDVIKEAGPASKAQRPEKRSSFGSNAQALQMRPKKRPANGHEYRSETNSPSWLTKHMEEERIIHPCGAYNKRRRKNNLEAPGWNERMSLPSKNSIKHRLS